MKTMHRPKNILIIRNDKLGDFMLAWPAFQNAKQNFPDSTIYALVPAYTKDMAEQCPWIDKVIIDNNKTGLSGLLQTAATLRMEKIDAVMCLHSTPRIAAALFIARIPHRFAPASRIDQIFYNHTLTQRRSRSEKPEYEYNIDLIKFMSEFFGITNNYALNPPLLTFNDKEINTIKQDFYSNNNIHTSKKLIFIHAGCGGSASNLSISQYSDLIIKLSSDKSLFFVLTPGPGEEEAATEQSHKIGNIPHVIYNSVDGLISFTKTLSIATIFISGSTGTLHIAGALNVPTAAFYPARKSGTKLRWQTLNTSRNRISFSPDSHTGSSDMSEIDINICAISILKFLANK